MAQTGIKTNVVSGLKWNSASFVATKSTDFLVKLILARLLLPDAFGLVGMAMIIIGFLEVLSDMGLFNALVQRKDDELTNVRYSSAFWFLLVLSSIFVACFFLFISPLGAAFYEEPDLVPVLNALSLYLFFNILAIIPRVILTKQLNFKLLVKITFAGTIASSVIAIGMAFFGLGVWSLVAKSLTSAGIVFTLYWINVSWRPRFVFRRSTLTQLAGYSIFIQLDAIFHFFRSNLDYLIIGKLVSAHLLGIYYLAFMLSETLRSQIYSIFNKVFFPIYSKLQDNPDQIKHYYLKVMRFTAAVTFPISVVFIGMAETVILVVFGEKWLEAAPPLRALAIASMIFALSGAPVEVLNAIGKPAISFYLNLINTTFVALPLIYLGQVYFGLAGVGYAVCIHYTTSRIAYHYYMKKYIGITDKDVYHALREPVMAALTMLLVIAGISTLELRPLLLLIVAGGAGGVTYVLFFLKDLKQGVKMIVHS